ncbi:MAG: hypothetical protein WBE76_17835 [Terracidiphilus sp.]
MTFAASAAPAPQPNASSVIQGVDRAVMARFEGIEGYTVTEHYAVYRGQDEIHPAAAMTVKTTYRKDSGKSYQILSQSGSGIIIKFGLDPLLENEKRINDPADREASWFTSANYEMKLKSGQTERVNGHDCLALSITPKHKAANLLIGTIWVDANDYTILRIGGISSKRPTIWSGPAHMVRDYAEFSGFSEATHARAVSDSTIFGRSIVTIDYDGYQIELARKQ